MTVWKARLWRVDCFTDQFAFRPTGSTTATLIALLHTVCTMLSTNPFVRVFAIDFSKAFDSIRHYQLHVSLLQMKSITGLNIFLADRTIGRAFGTVSRLSSVRRPSSVTFCIVAKRCVLAKKCLREWIGNQGQKVHFLGRRHISTSGFAATATETAFFALFLPVQPSNR